MRAGVCVTWQGSHPSKRAAGPDVWPPLTVRSRRGWSAEGPCSQAPPTRPGLLSRAGVIDVNSAAFVPKAQRHAE